MEELNNLSSKPRNCNITEFDNWLTDTVKKILKHNPPTDDDIVKYVNNEYDNTFFYDPSIKKPKTTMNGFMYEYRQLNPRGTRIQDLKQFKALILSKVSELRNFGDNFKDTVKKWNPRPKAFAEAVSKLFFNVHNNEETLEAVRRFFANIQYNIGNKKFYKQGTILYLDSKDIGGVGKGYLMDALRIYLNNHNIANSNVNIFGPWYGREFNSNIVGFVSECEYRYLDHNIVNNIVDNVDYTVKIKFEPEYSAHSYITIIAGSNHRPVEKNNRRFGIVEYNVYPYSRWTAEEKTSHNRDDYDELFDTLMNTVPVEPYYVMDTSLKDNYDDSIIYGALCELYNEGLIEDKTYTKKALYDMITSVGCDSDEYEHITKKNIELYMLKLVQRGQIKDYPNMGTHRYRGILEFISNTIQDNIPKEDSTPISECTNRWDNILKDMPEDVIVETVQEPEISEEPEEDHDEIDYNKTMQELFPDMFDSEVHEIKNKEGEVQFTYIMYRCNNNTDKYIDKLEDIVDSNIKAKFPQVPFELEGCIKDEDKDREARICIRFPRIYETGTWSFDDYGAEYRTLEQGINLSYDKPFKKFINDIIDRVSTYVMCNQSLLRMRNI